MRSTLTERSRLRLDLVARLPKERMTANLDYDTSTKRCVVVVVVVVVIVAVPDVRWTDLFDSFRFLRFECVLSCRGV